MDTYTIRYARICRDFLETESSQLLHVSQKDMTLAGTFIGQLKILENYKVRHRGERRRLTRWCNTVMLVHEVSQVCFCLNQKFIAYQ